MDKLIASAGLILIATPIFATPVNVSFWVDATGRYTSINNTWVQDSSFLPQQFMLTVTFDSTNFNPDVVSNWGDQNTTSAHINVSPLVFGATPFDNELNNIQPTLDYHGNENTIYPGILGGDLSYNGSDGSSSTSQMYYLDRGFLYNDSQAKYTADFNKETYLDFSNYSADLSEADVAQLTLEDFLNMGYGQTFGFHQNVVEEYNLNWGEWITIDGSTQYTGIATLSNVSFVPVPSALWLFGSGLLGLVGLARKAR
ncbi:MAG: hypothetical protein HYZ31_05005 [Gammaproteobacteria bacterium]|nr:hypothetical protein [Gammaproteobacteria bacterium]